MITLRRYKSVRWRLTTGVRRRLFYFEHPPQLLFNGSTVHNNFYRETEDAIEELETCGGCVIGITAKGSCDCALEHASTMSGSPGTPGENCPRLKAVKLEIQNRNLHSAVSEFKDIIASYKRTLDSATNTQELLFHIIEQYKIEIKKIRGEEVSPDEPCPCMKCFRERQ